MNNCSVCVIYNTYFRVPLKSSLSTITTTLSKVHKFDWLARCHSSLCKAGSESVMYVRLNTGSPEEGGREREGKRERGRGREGGLNHYVISELWPYRSTPQED